MNHYEGAYLSCAACVGCKIILSSSHKDCERLEVRASYFNHSCDASTLCNGVCDRINVTTKHAISLVYLLLSMKYGYSRLQ